MTGSDIEARIGVEKQKQQTAEAKARSLEATVATRSKDGRFARAAAEGSHDALLSTLTRPAKHAALVAALYPTGTQA
jgi:hypothetical protein